MISLLLAFVIAQTPPRGDEPPRLRTIMPNGAVVLVEPNQTSKSLIVHLFASSRGVDESKTSGLRHLLEHLCVKGSDGTLDVKLEAQAAFLSAHVLRDAFDVEIQAPPEKLKLALDAIKDVLVDHKFTADEIKHEAGIIEQEVDIREDSGKLAASVWKSAYGGNGADPIGELETIKAATPDALEEVRKATFATANLVLVIEGPVGLAEGTRLGKELMGPLPKTTADTGVERAAANPSGREVISDAFGEAAGLPVPPLTDPKCIAALCAAFAIASELPDSFVTYTPSAINGMVVVGDTDDIGKVTKTIDMITTEGADGWFVRGRSLGMRWAARQVATPESSAYTRGLLVSRDVSVRFEAIQELFRTVSVADFREAVAAFGQHSFVAVGQP